MSNQATTSPSTPNVQASHRSRKALAIAALVIAAGAFGFLALGDIGENLVYYYSPSELIENRDQAIGASVRLGGLVAEHSVVENREDGNDHSLRFSVTDGDTVIPVEASAVPPAMFREGIGVVVEGTLRADGIFETTRLMVKHDNEYRAPGEGEEKSLDRLLETMQFDSGNAY